MKTRIKSSRARVDRPVNRIEFNRLQPAVEDMPEADASGASGPAHEKKIKSGSVGSYLSPPKRKSSAKKSFKTKSPMSAPASMVADVAGIESPGAKSPEESGKKKKASWTPSSVPSLLESSLLEDEDSDDSAVGSGDADLPSVTSSFDEDPLRDSVVSADGKLNFNSAFPCVAAAVGKNHTDRNLLVSKQFPILDPFREDFARFVREFDWEDHYWLNIRSSAARKLTLAYLRRTLAPCSYFEAEKFLQLSHIVHQRFVAGDDGTPAEHFALACAIGQIVKEGTDSHRDSERGHHGVEHLFDDGGYDERSLASGNPLALSSDAAKSTISPFGSESGNVGKKINEVIAPDVPQSGASPSGSAKNACAHETIQQGFDAADYLEKLAAEMRLPAMACNQDRTSHASNLALDKVIDDLRSKLPASLAEAAIRGLLGANDQLREAPWVNSPGVVRSSPADLGRNYRLGILSAEDRHIYESCGRSC